MKTARNSEVTVILPPLRLLEKQGAHFEHADQALHQLGMAGGCLDRAQRRALWGVLGYQIRVVADHAHAHNNLQDSGVVLQQCVIRQVLTDDLLPCKSCHLFTL